MEKTDKWEVGYWNKALMNMELVAGTMPIDPNEKYQMQWMS